MRPSFNSTRNIREAWLIRLDATYARRVAEVETRVLEGYFESAQALLLKRLNEQRTATAGGGLELLPIER